MTIVLHPDRYIERTKPLKETTIDVLNELIDSSDDWLSLSHTRGDKAEDPVNKMGYRFRYYAYLIRDLHVANQQAQEELAELKKLCRKQATNIRKLEKQINKPVKGARK